MAKANNVRGTVMMCVAVVIRQARLGFAVTNVTI